MYRTYYNIIIFMTKMLYYKCIFEMQLHASFYLSVIYLHKLGHFVSTIYINILCVIYIQFQWLIHYLIKIIFGYYIGYNTEYLCVKFEFNDNSKHTKNDFERRQSVILFYLVHNIFYDIAIKVIYFNMITSIGWFSFWQKHCI